MGIGGKTNPPVFPNKRTWSTAATRLAKVEATVLGVGRPTFDINWMHCVNKHESKWEPVKLAEDVRL